MHKALTIALIVVVSSPATAQDSTRVGTDSSSHATLYRNPHTARLLATVVPGAGYAYTGEYLRGYATWVITFTSVTVGPLIFADDCYGFLSPQCGKSGHSANMLTGGLLIALGVSTWVSSVKDAPKSAERANERHRRELETHPVLEVDPQSINRLKAGLSIGW